MTPAAATAWVVVVPVKPAHLAKSRLALGGVDRAALARAVAIDTVRAAAAAANVAEVLVVTDDEGIAQDLRGTPGINVVAEEGPRGLNGAIAWVAGSLSLERPRAALLGDLPALRSSDLASALALAGESDRAVVADAEGTGSTLVTAAPGLPLITSFGADSLARHVGDGCRALGIATDSTLRRDVDTAEHLLQARELGLGAHTAAVLAGAEAAA